MPTQCEAPLAIGDILRRTGQPFHRVRYAMRTRGIIPFAKVGSCNLYSRQHLSQIEQALKEIDRTKAGRPRAGEASHA